METLFDTWIEKEKRVSRDAEKRRYPHFDPKIKFGRNIAFFKAFLLNPGNVAKHSFYPFIRMELETPRYKKGEDIDQHGKKVRKITKKGFTTNIRWGTGFSYAKIKVTL
ncbi:MAG: hypothetical protein U5Q03_04190 [Bacteroidota bacterium]|nr:hypothetical protein [Bacteroidota bacterium]